MAGHKHAAAMAEYAKDAAETERPWERWESRINLPGHGTSWRGHAAAIAWDEDREYRRKPRTLKIAGREIEEPLSSLVQGQEAWSWDAVGFVVQSKPATFDNQFWSHAVTNGRAFSTPEAAKAAYDAITALLTGKNAA